MGSSLFTLFSIKDLIDILLVATLLYYLYRTMKDSGSLDIFVGIFAFVVAWVVMYKMLDMRLIGTIMDKFIDIGLFILVILFQDEIKRFLTELGSRRGLKFVEKLFKSKSEVDVAKKWIMPVVYACMNLSKTKTGAPRGSSRTSFSRTARSTTARSTLPATRLRARDASFPYLTTPTFRDTWVCGTARLRACHRLPTPSPLLSARSEGTSLMPTRGNCTWGLQVPNSRTPSRPLSRTNRNQE